MPTYLPLNHVMAPLEAVMSPIESKLADAALSDYQEEICHLPGKNCSNIESHKEAGMWFLNF